MLGPERSPHLEANLEAHRRKWGTSPGVEVVEAFADSHWVQLHGACPTEGASSWLERTAAGRPLPETLCVIGAGLGYVIDLIAERSDSRILVLEPEPALVPWFFARRDWRSLIESGRLLALAGPEFEGSQHAWRLFGDGNAEPLVLAHPVLSRARPEAARMAAQVIGRARRGARGNEEARRRFAAPYLVNTLRNVPTLTKASSVDVLVDGERGVPIVLAAAGPSLNRNIEELRPWRDRLVLIAVDTALKPLVAAGMAPDFVVALDPSDANARHLTDVAVPAHTSLVAEPSIAPISFASFADRVFAFRVGEHAPWPWLRSMGIDCGMLRAWGSVVTSAFDLALRMGGDPIVCVGTDLAYTGGQIYARGTTYEEDWLITAGPDRPVEWVWEQVVAARGVPARGIGGEDIPTTRGLVAFRDWLVEESKRPGMPRLVNATGAGILHGGRFEQRTLAELGLPDRRPRLATRLKPAACSRRPADRIDAHLLEVLMNPHDAPMAKPSTHVMPYRERPRLERVASTRALRAEGGSDVDRWSDPANLDPAWERRAAVVGRLVPPASRVLDLGAGLEALARHIPADCTYTPADLVRRSSRTEVADVNRGEFPEGEFDVVAALGLLEYVHDVPALLSAIRQRVRLMVTTYCARTTDDPRPRLERGWVNEFTRDEFVLLCQKAGWQVVGADCLDVTPGFDQWVFALRGR